MSRTNRVLFASCVALASLFAAASYAQGSGDTKPQNPNSSSSKKAPGSGPNPYRDCGIGAALFSNTGWAAVTSNVIWDIGLTASTSATSSPETCNGKEAKVAQFIADTYVAVVDETARGQGEHLTAMLELYECPSAVHGDIVNTIRADVGSSVAQPEYGALTTTEKAERYYLILDRHVRTGFAQSCAV